MISLASLPLEIVSNNSYRMSGREIIAPAGCKHSIKYFDLSNEKPEKVVEPQVTPVVKFCCSMECCETGNAETLEKMKEAREKRDHATDEVKKWSDWIAKHKEGKRHPLHLHDPVEKLHEATEDLEDARAKLKQLAHKLIEHQEKHKDCSKLRKAIGSSARYSN